MDFKVNKFLNSRATPLEAKFISHKNTEFSPIKLLCANENDFNKKYSFYGETK